MSAHLDVELRNERVLRMIERANLQPSECPAKESRKFADLSAVAQRSAIADYIRRYPMQAGLRGEAINEHALSKQIAAAFDASDMDQFKALADIAIRQYVGAVIQSEWDRRD